MEVEVEVEGEEEAMLSRYLGRQLIVGTGGLSFCVACFGLVWSGARSEIDEVGCGQRCFCEEIGTSIYVLMVVEEGF